MALKVAYNIYKMKHNNSPTDGMYPNTVLNETNFQSQLWLLHTMMNGFFTLHVESCESTVRVQ